jgi:hypothetical protein
MLASKAPSCVDIARDAAMGRVYLVLAHQAAKIDATPRQNGAFGTCPCPLQQVGCLKFHKWNRISIRAAFAAANCNAMMDYYLRDLYV